MAVELAEISYVVRPRLLLGLHRVAELVGIVASSSLGHWQAALFWELVLHSWAASLIGIGCVVQPRLLWKSRLVLHMTAVELVVIRCRA